MATSGADGGPDAHAAALAAEVTRLRAELAQAWSEADATLFRVTRLAKVITALGRPSEADEARPAAEVAELFSCDVGLLLLGKDDTNLAVAERWGITTELLPARRLAIPGEVTAQVTSGASVLAAPAGQAPVLEGLAPLALQHVAWVRLVVDDAHLGFLMLGRRGELAFTGSDTHELQAVGNRVALSLDNARLHRRTEAQVVQLRRLLHLGTRLAGTVELDEAGRIIATTLRESAPDGTVGVYRREGPGWALVTGSGATRLPRRRLPEERDGVVIHRLHDGQREVGCVVTLGLPDDDEHRQLLAHLVHVAGLAMSKILLHERTAHQARHDALTGLCNRTLLRERVEQALALDRGGVALVFCDLDRFKVVNDTLGHDAGDQLLMEVARRLQATVRPQDTVARLGGDEFVVLCTDVADRGMATRIAERIGEAVAPPMEIDGRRLTISASQGVVLATPEATADTLLRDADAAMYQAKARGRDRYELFDARVRVALDERARIEADLRTALERRRLRLVYQPVVELETGRLRAVEALLRYVAEDGRLVPAAEFIEVAEESDLIVDLGAWVIDEACRQMAAWQRDLGTDAPEQVLINVAARQLARDVDANVGAALARYGLAPTSIGLELTESGLIVSDDDMLGCLARLRRGGVRVGIDDFGTGYSSLTYLKRFPVDFVKIDREFVQGMVAEGEDASIVDAILRLGDALGLKTVAEGVETSAQRDGLLDLGCVLSQGYLFSHPLGPTDLEAWLASGVQPSVPAEPDRRADAPVPAAPGA